VKELFKVREHYSGTAVILEAGNVKVFVSGRLPLPAAEAMAKDLNDVCSKYHVPETDSEKAARYERALKRILNGIDPLDVAKEALEQ